MSAAKLADAPPPYDTVVFDCDSTLSAMEGIEELAGERLDDAAKARLATLTNAAMNGEVPLEEVYGARLELVNPGRADVEAIGHMYVEKALPHARALVAALQALDKDVHVVSGGLLPAVAVLSDALGIARANTQAVDVHFAPDGRYAGFETTSALARAGGKITVLQALRDGSDAAAPKAAPRRIAFIGDGATDVEAGHLCRRFIAFGGVLRRANVFDQAAVGTESADLAALVPLLFSGEELETLRARGDHRDLLSAVPSP